MADTDPDRGDFVRNYQSQQQRATGFNYDVERDRLKRERENMALMHKRPASSFPSIVNLHGTVPDERTMLKWREGYLRYELLRTLNPQEYRLLWEHCGTMDKRFDDEVDEMVKDREYINQMKTRKTTL